MSGVAVIRHLLANNAGVLAVVPATSIEAGDLPLKAVLPGISVKQIVSVPYNQIRTNEAGKVHTDHVQVTWLFKGPQGTPAGTGYPGVKAMGLLVLAACPSQRGTVNGIAVDSIVPSPEGPDVSDAETDLHSCSRDFTVKWIGA